MKHITLTALLISCSASAIADDVTFNLCNKYSTGPKSVLVKDKMNGMAKLFQSSINRDACVQITAQSTDGKFAEIEITVDQGAPYGVPWISSNDTVDF